MSITPSTSNRELRSHRGVNTPASRLGSHPFLDASRFIALASVWASAWMIGGFYHRPRFLILIVLSAAVILMCFDLKHVLGMLRRATWVGGLAIGLGIIALFQLVPLPPSLNSALSGTFELRQLYASATAETWATMSLVPWETANWLVLALIAVTGLFLGSTLLGTPTTKTLLLASVSICGATQVFWGIVQLAVHPDEIFWGIPNEGGSIPFGTFLVRNHGADFVGMSLLCAIGWFRMTVNRHLSQGKSSYGRQSGYATLLSQPSILALGLLVLWLLVGLLCTNSRGGWLSMLVTLVVLQLIWKRHGKSRQWGWAVGILVISLGGILLVQSLSLLDRFENRVGELEIDRVLDDGRWQLWKDSLPAVAHYFPMGSGFGTYGYSYLPFEPTPSNGWLPNAHNQYLETLIEAGIPGLLLLSVLIWFTGKASISLCSSARSPEKQALGLAAMGCLIFQSVHAVTEFGLLMPANSLTLCLLLGGSVAASQLQRQKTRSGRTKQTGVAAGAQRVKTNDVVVQAKPSGMLVPMVLLAFVGCGLAAGLWHQSRNIRSDRLLAMAEFEPATPSPPTTMADQWIEKIDAELQRSPQNERLRRRLIQLYLHRAQRSTYDQIRTGQISSSQPTNPVADWDRTSLESVIAILYDTSDAGPTEIQKQRISRMVAEEPSLEQAWKELGVSLVSNPIQPKTHMRLTQLAAASGRPWRDQFEHSMRLSSVDPRQSLGNGLLAWAAGDIDSMIDQWRQTLSVDLSQLELIYRLARLKLTDDALNQRLMPKRWKAPYRLALLIRDDPGVENLRQQLLKTAMQDAKASSLDTLAKSKAMGTIARAQNDYAGAIGYYEQAVESDLKDPELRYFLAYSLYHSGKGDEAASQARVAMKLAPGDDKYKNLFEQSRRLHYKQSTTLRPIETP